MKKSAVKLARAAIIAALYAVLTVVTAPISYGSVQFRIAECLCILAFFYDEAVVGLTIGCVIANLFSPSSMLDVVLGSAATFVACLLSNLTFKAIKNRVSGFIVGILFPIVINALVVPIAIITVSPDEGSYIIVALQIAAGQAGVLLTAGVVLYVVLLKLLDKGILNKGILKK